MNMACVCLHDDGLVGGFELKAIRGPPGTADTLLHSPDQLLLVRPVLLIVPAQDICG